MFRRIRLICISLLIGLAAYIVYAGVLVPGFVIPRTLRVHRSSASGTDGALSELEILSRSNDDLLETLFPKEDWRRKQPLCLMLKSPKCLLLVQGETESLEGSSFSAEACTIVIPSSDAALDQKEQFRRAVVVETNDKVLFRFNRNFNFQTLTDFQFDMLTEGRLTGEVKIWSKDPVNDFSMTMRDVSFNAEQAVTDSDVIFHRGDVRVEGKGLYVRIGLPEKKEKESENENEAAGPLIDRLLAGNLGGGFSIRDIRLSKLNLLEFEVPDFLPSLPKKDGWDEAEDVQNPELAGKKTMKMDVRCGGELFFAPNMTDAPAVWCARFSSDVEITAFHEEREPDTLRCEYLYLYLIDPLLKQDWDQYGSSWKRKRRPSGNLVRLIPHQVRAIGSEERKSVLQIADSFFRAESGEILCEIDQQRLSLDPLPSMTGEDGTPEKTPSENDGAFLQYGGTSVTSDRIEFTYDPNTYGSLKAYRKGKLTSEIPDSDGSVSHVSVVWNKGVQIIPTPDYGEGVYTASFRGDVGFDWDRFGSLTAKAADFWFTVFKNGKSEESGSSLSGSDLEEEEGSVSIRPKSARLTEQVMMKTERGTCNIQDRMEILFTEAAEISGKKDLPPASGNAGSSAAGIFSGKGGSLMGGEDGENLVFSLSSGKLQLWTVMTGGGIEVSQINLENQVRIRETDLSGQDEKLRIDGTAISVRNPGSERAVLSLRGRPAEFNGYGLYLAGYNIDVDREKNTFSVNGSGRLQITPRIGDSNAEAFSSASALTAAKSEPIEVWWPKGMFFDGKSLVFQGDGDSGDGKSAAKENRLVRVLQGRSLELKSQLISLILKRPVQIFELDMNRNGEGGMSGIELDKAVCQGSLQVPVSIAWYGAVPLSGEKTGKNQRGLRGKGRGEVSHLTFTMGTGDFSASGPGWLRGTIETPEEMMKQTAGGEKRDGSGDLKSSFPVGAPKAWTHFHLLFHDMMTGNINDQSLKVNDDVRSVVATSDSPDLELDANEQRTFPEDAFFLTCNELGGAGTLSPVSGGRNFEVSAFGNTRFTYQNVTGLGEILKYDHLKRAVILQGNGVTPASLNLQDRPGAPVNTQTFNSASFNLETKKLDMSISGISFSNEK